MLGNIKYQAAKFQMFISYHCYTIPSYIFNVWKEDVIKANRYL